MFDEQNERIAKVILEHRWPGLKWDNVEEKTRESYRRTAELVIEAMKIE